MDKETISILKDYFKNQPVKKAYIFGSVARNENDVDSDIDILLELDYINHIGMKFIGMHIELEKILNRKVDLLTSNSVSKYIKPIIEKEKKLIYER